MNWSKKISLLLPIFLLSCSVDTVITSSEENTTYIQSSKNKLLSDKELFVKQTEEIIKKYPESKKLFTDWQTESNEALEIKKASAKNLNSMNILTDSEILNINSEKPLVKAESFKPVDFSKDQGNHMSKLTEWWYYNGHLKTDDGKEFGYEFCLFRGSPIVYFAHVGITDVSGNKFSYIREFYPPTKVKLKKETADINYANDQVIQQIGDFSYRIKGKTNNQSFDLKMTLENKKPLMINGNGLIDMPEGIDSYYYSLTRLKTEGSISEGSKVSNVKGTSWMDHQWGNFYVLRTGWDWFSFQMDDGTDYNLFSFRSRKDQTLKQFVNVTDAQSKASVGSKMNLKRLSWWNSFNTSDLYVNKWEVSLPERNEKFIVQAQVDNQEVYPTKPYDIAPTYWEGTCNITKIMPDGKEIKGMGYIEHFPYRQVIN
jgi:predicted secreted hydrolase